MKEWRGTLADDVEMLALLHLLVERSIYLHRQTAC
jgi:hypothetical protein